LFITYYISLSRKGIKLAIKLRNVHFLIIIIIFDIPPNEGAA
jgi:hypothetical protein